MCASRAPPASLDQAQPSTSPCLPPQVVAGLDGISVLDQSALTPDAIVVSANNAVCSSVVNVVHSAVPLPFA